MCRTGSEECRVWLLQRPREGECFKGKVTWGECTGVTRLPLDLVPLVTLMAACKLDRAREG